MCDVRIYLKWLGVSVIITLNWCCYLSDGTCLFPGRQTNERITFSVINKTYQYPPNTTAKYTCPNDLTNEVFKEAICLANGTWTFTKSSLVNCSQAPGVRCHRPVQPGISSSINAIILGNHCFTLHKNITVGTWNSLKFACDVDLFVPQPELVASLKDSMCNASLFNNEVPKKIFLTMRTSNHVTPVLPSASEASSFGSRLLPSTHQRSFLDCFSKNSHEAIIQSSSESITTFWICRHGISSCGIPSQEKYSTMNSSGKYVNNTADYNCQSGYETGDVRQRRCQEDGYWSGHPPVCIGSTKNGFKVNQVNGQSSESNENTSNSSGLKPGEEELLKIVIGVIVGVTLFIIVLMWLVMAVLLWRHKRKDVGGNKLPN